MTVLKAASQNNANRIVGQWMSEENNMAVEIYKAGKFYEAKVIWVDNSNHKSSSMNAGYDNRNPDETLRKRKIIGLVVMNSLMYNEQNNDWEQGQIYDPHSGKYWNAKACLTKDGYLKVRGYWDFQLLGKDLLFKRILPNNFLTTTK